MRRIELGRCQARQRIGVAVADGMGDGDEAVAQADVGEVAAPGGHRDGMRVDGERMPAAFARQGVHPGNRRLIEVSGCDDVRHRCRRVQGFLELAH